MRAQWRRTSGTLLCRLGLTLAACAIGGSSPWAQGATRVVELFTSQGCPKCPAADRLIADLARRPDTIALSFPVNYWDYIGWKDTLASSAFTLRQHAYATARGDGLVYTPQAVVDGRAAHPGADRGAILDGARSADMAGPAPQVRVREADGKLVIDIDADLGHATSPAGVYVLRVVRQKTVEIGRGENSGRTLTYTNVVRAMDRVGGWSGAAVHFELHELKGDDEGFVVLLQDGTPDRPGAILAAAKTANL